MPQRLLEHLARLIECDSQNPPRNITPEASMFVYARSVLKAAGFSVSMTAYGDGHVNLFARRGGASVLFNCHLDTVPVGEGWTKPPLELTVENERAYGRGACDIKGAAAALLALAESSEARMAILFSSDEEGAGGCCVRNFLDEASHRRFKQVVVCEPTDCRATLAHRGYLSVKGRFTGIAGHSSEGRALADSAIHRMARWTCAALSYCESEKAAGRPTGFNVGLASGGTKSNVIAGEANLHYSARLGPGESNEELLAELSGLGGADQCANWHVPFSGPPLPAAGQDEAPVRAFCERHGLRVGEPVDFWTEASLFSAAGMPTMVLGPGDIAQAHTADEWVTLDQLERARNLYQRIVEHA
ncbi:MULTISPECIES: acetylornithine deacetylase [unclassified Wenzhouxiangella]|uniref:acetylornithine deacetylase n=1 Tax=unclassified Wenzhouxiangella TaxID=2613841 RepID=UPI000E3251C9|nr:MULTISPECIES: acetylornithine deacetylase [unclassified Wenzhouxiangella]RFF26928.1 acetylornithine deacetylase [Wenzhouxiangella sp. 15181]RFP69441.1 acetylornithine deacetylase [Wenzhouxiangella sp. 15190]